MMKRITLVAELMLILAMGAGKFGLLAAGPQKTTAETLKGLEGESPAVCHPILQHIASEHRYGGPQINSGLS